MVRIHLLQPIMGIGETGEVVAVSSTTAKKFIKSGMARDVDAYGQPVGAPVEPVVAPPTDEPVVEPEALLQPEEAFGEAFPLEQGPDEVPQTRRKPKKGKPADSGSALF